MGTAFRQARILGKGHIAGFLMSVEVSYPHIEKIEGSPARLERLPRIRVAQIVIDYLNHGWSADEICIHYPHSGPPKSIRRWRIISTTETRLTAKSKRNRTWSPRREQMRQYRPW